MANVVQIQGGLSAPSRKSTPTSLRGQLAKLSTADRLPDEVTTKDIDLALQDIDAEIGPNAWSYTGSERDVKAFTVLMRPLIQFCEVFGMFQTGMSVSRYLEFIANQVSDIPPVWLARAIERLVQEYRYQTLPKPADIRERVPDEFWQQKNERCRLAVFRLAALDRDTAATRHAEQIRRIKALPLPSGGPVSGSAGGVLAELAAKLRLEHASKRQTDGE